MPLDRALVDLDLVRLGDDGELLEETLREQFVLFLRAGGVVTWDLWAALSDRSRRALLEAQERLFQDAEVDTALEDCVRGMTG